MTDINPTHMDESRPKYCDTFDFNGLKILRQTTNQAIEIIVEAIESGTKLKIAFCNANTLLQAYDNPQYQTTLSKMTLFNDGIGADIASKILTGKAFPENLNGTDFVPTLMETCTRPLKFYLLGAKPEIVKLAAANFESQFPYHTVVGYHSGYFFDDEFDRILDEINAQKPDILLVAMGNPKQEFLIEKNFDKLNIPVIMGVGGLFDFTAQAVRRAPVWMRMSKIEWIFRLIQEPRRLAHRYTIGTMRFLFLILKMRFQSK